MSTSIEDNFLMAKNMIKLYIFLAFFYYISNTNNIYLMRFNYHYQRFFDMMNKMLHAGLLYDDKIINDVIENENINDDKKESISQKTEIKYEDKYLEKMRQMDKQFHFTDEELKMRNETYLKMLKQELERPDIEITDIENQLIVAKKDISDLLDQDFVLDNEYQEDDFDSDEYKMILINDKQDKIKELEKKLEELKSYKSQITEDDVRNIVEERVQNYIMKKHLERLKNCYIMEKTPLGNVIMIYNSEREIFQYYSDNTIPYRYLEPIGRKYVITFDCRPIFIDMEEELKIAEEKLKEKEEQEKMKLEEINNSQIKKENKSDSLPKKNVFAKFKSYNKEAGAGKHMVPPPKNSITNNSTKNNDDKNEKVLLKDRANRYSHEGRFSNFNILKKVDKKVVCKKYGMSFSEFKKMQQQPTKSQT